MRHTVASVDRVPLTGRSLSKSGVVPARLQSTARATQTRKSTANYAYAAAPPAGASFCLLPRFRGAIEAPGVASTKFHNGDLLMSLAADYTDSSSLARPPEETLR